MTASQLEDWPIGQIVWMTGRPECERVGRGKQEEGRNEVGQDGLLCSSRESRLAAVEYYEDQEGSDQGVNGKCGDVRPERMDGVLINPGTSCCLRFTPSHVKLVKHFHTTRN